MRMLLKIFLLNIKKNIGKSLLIIMTLLIAVISFYSTLQMKSILTESEISNLRSKSVGNSDYIMSKSNGWFKYSERLNNIHCNKITKTLNYSGIINKPDDTVKLSLIGVNPKEFKDNFYYEINEGQDLNDNSDGIIISEDTKNTLKCKVGDKIKVNINNEFHKIKVAGIARSEGYFSTNEDRALININKLRRILNVGNDNISALYLSTNDNVTLIKNNIKNIYGNEMNVTASVDKSFIKSDVSSYSIIIYIIILFVIIIGSMVILSTYKVILTNRFKLLGTVRTIGITKDKILLLLILEGLFYCAAALVIGLITAVTVKNSILNNLVKYLKPSDYVDTSGAIYVLLTVAFIVILMSTNIFFAYKNIKNKSIRELINGVYADRNEGIKFSQICATFIFIILCFFTLIKSEYSLVIAIILFMLIIISFSFFTKTIINIMQIAFKKVKKSGIFLLSLKNLLGNRLLTKNVVLLAVGGLILILINVFVYSTSIELVDFYKGYNCDLIFSNNRISQQDINIINKQKDVSAAYPYINKELKINKDEIVKGRFIDNIDKYNEFYDMKLENKVDNDKFNNGRNIIITKIIASKDQLKLGDKLTLASDMEKHEYTVAGISDTMMNQGETVYMPRNYGKSDFNESDANAILIKTQNVSARRVKKTLLNTVKSKDADIAIVSELIAGDRRNSTQIFLLFYVFAILASLIGFIGIVNNLTISILSRNKELLTLRALGITKHRLFLMIIFEEILSGAIGGILASIGALFSLNVVERILILIGLAMPVHLSLEEFLIIILLFILISIIPAVFLASKINKKGISQQLREE